MGALTPTPVTLENLIDLTSKINIFNDAVVTQAISPRTLGTDTITVAVTDNVLSPTLTSGTCDVNTVNTITDTSEDFVALGVEVGDFAVNTASGISAVVTIVTTTVVTLNADICPLGNEAYLFRKPSFFVQKAFGGEWKASNARTGNDKGVSYTLPVNTATVVVHDIVYPIALANIGTYPPIS